MITRSLCQFHYINNGDLILIFALVGCFAVVDKILSVNKLIDSVNYPPAVDAV